MKGPILFLAAICLLPLQALEMSRLYTDNMVLQSGRTLEIRGRGTPGETVRLELGGKNFTGKTDPSGKWKIELPAQNPGGPHEMKITADSGSQTIRNLLFGEVWLASGQSNMHMELQQTDGASAEIAASTDPELRIFKVRAQSAVTPAEDVQGAWMAASPATAKTFAAVPYYFAKELRRELKVPVGIIAASLGGTEAESWMSPDLLKRLPETAARYEELRKAIPVVERSPRKVDIDDSGWMKEGISPEGWNRQAKRIHWDYELYPIEYDGVIWARKTVELPADWAGKDLTLSLGAVDDFETTYFNGEEVGKTTKHTLARRLYEIPGRLVKAGMNTLAVKTSKIGWGGLIGPENVMFLQKKGTEDKVPVGGEWLYRASRLEFKGISSRLPSSLYNGMIEPILGYGFRGVIWYQGEANAYPAGAKKYRNVFGALIEDWRKEFGLGKIPFYYVQLAGFKNSNGEGWPLLRDAQRRTLEIHNTGMATAVDIGNPKDIHPGNKREVGRRLALWALVKDYGQKKVPSGPLYRSMKTENGKLRVSFDYADGLRSKDGQPLRHFEVADKDGRFLPAEAVIDGSSVVVFNRDIAVPVAVRYAWKDYPEALNFINGAELPASPFIGEAGK